MGKRKERRLAAMMAAGRRVKLDLFAEPTGEMVEASLNGKAGGGFDQNDHPVECKSPSSSENPLLLLGQYSDDELDEAEVDKLQIAETENPHAGKVLEANGEGNDEMESNSAKSSTPHDNTEDVACKFNLLQAVDNVDKDDISKGETATMLDSLCEANGTVSISNVEPSEPQSVGDNAVAWKAVMHEQSGRYYYWNVETGETSWERPNSLTSEMLPVGDEGDTCAVTDGDGVLSGPKEFLVLNGEPTAPPDVHLSKGSEFATPLNYCSSTLHDTKPEDVPEMKISISDDGKNGGAEDSFVDTEGTQTLSVDLVSSTKVAVQHALIDSRHENSLDNEESSTKSKIIQDEEFQGKLVESDQLIECSNSLLRRLTELHRLDGTIEGRNRRSKYSLEVEVRLSDCNALSPFGFSLLPLWLHIEAHLEQLAVIINEEEASLLASKHVKAVDSQYASPGRHNDDARQNFTAESETKIEDEHLDASVIDGSGMTKSGTVVDETIEQPPVPSDDTDSPSISPNRAAVDGLLEGEIGSSLIDDHVDSSPNPEIGRTGGQDVSMPYSGKTADLVESLHHDVDMDVDMEVDEDCENQNVVLQTASSTNYSLPAEQQTFASPQPSVEPLPLILVPVGEPCPPPPSEEPPEGDWIPPPPPDNDPAPPPPPDDPPVPQYASSSLYAHHENMYPPLSYAQHYSFTYTVPGLDYYGATTTEVPDGSYYPHSVGVGSQLEAQVQGYEEMVNPIAEAPVMTNSVGPIVYYETPGTESSASVTTASQSSGYHDIPGSISYHETLGANLVGSTWDSLHSLEVERVAPPFGTQEAPKQIAASSAMLPVRESSTVTTATAAAAAAAAATKNPSKGRVKKKTVAVASTLRSNKVSSLVDKWKAAKEEFRAEEKDEPLNAYEILERKRRREIEKWHAKQIATGEAQDNANFQPLGGDWRERVKRRRAEKRSSEPETESDQAPIEKQQPDVTELSENLPSGWQAYWDESSGQVYYGNSLTMETTWTRPVS